jgi:hypothetical protein
MLELCDERSIPITNLREPRITGTNFNTRIQQAQTIWCDEHPCPDRPVTFQSINSKGIIIGKELTPRQLGKEVATGTEFGLGRITLYKKLAEIAGDKTGEGIVQRLALTWNLEPESLEAA